MLQNHFKIVTKISYEHCHSIPLVSRENNRLQNSRRKSGRERKHEEGKECIIFASLHKTGDGYPTVILTREPAGGGEGTELDEESEIFALYRLAQGSYITSLNLSVFLV